MNKTTKRDKMEEEFTHEFWVRWEKLDIPPTKNS
jgi:hypothetical protein